MELRYLIGTCKYFDPHYKEFLEDIGVLGQKYKSKTVYTEREISKRTCFFFCLVDDDSKIEFKAKQKFEFERVEVFRMRIDKVASKVKEMFINAACQEEADEECNELEKLKSL